MLVQRGKEDVPGAGNTAAHQECLGVYCGGNVGQSHAQRVGHLIYLAGGESVAIAGSVKDVLGGKLGAAEHAGGVRVLVQQLLHAADHAGGAGILLQATVLAAAAGGRLMAVDRDVADLAARAVHTVDDFAVDDDTAAHAGAQRDHDGVLGTLGGAHPNLTQGSHIGVVTHQNFQAVQQAGELCGDVPLAPAAEVGADDGHDAGIQHRAGHTDAHALHLLGLDALLVHLAQDGSGQVLQDVLACIGGVGGNLPFFQQCAGSGEQTDFGGGAAKVNAECVLFHDSFTPLLRRTHRRILLIIV